MRIQDLTAGQEFRLDYLGKFEGQPVKYAGRSYQMRGDGRLRATDDGRIWTLEDCGLTKSTDILGPVWGAGKESARLEP